MIAAASAAGSTITKAQLARAHRAGLLPRPIQQALGYGKGTRSVYPEHSVNQLLRLCELKRQRRKFRDLGWMLWWEGFDVAPELLRDTLVEVARQWAEEWAQMRGADGELTESVEDFLDDAGTSALPSRTLRWVRRRAGSDEFPTVLDALMRLVAGRDVSGDIATDVVRALGLDLAQTEALPDTEPWLDTDPLDGIRAAGILMDPSAMCATAAAISMEDLRLATDRARGLLDVFQLLGEVLGYTLGRWSLGFGLVGAIGRDTRTDTSGQAILVLFVHGLSSIGMAPNADLVISSGSELRKSAAMIAFLRDLTDALPDASGVVSRTQLAKAMLEPRAQARLETEIRGLRMRHPEEIDRLLTQHGPI